MLRPLLVCVLFVSLTGCGEKSSVGSSADAAPAPAAEVAPSTLSQSELQAQEAEARLRIIRAEAEAKIIQDAQRAEEDKQVNTSLVNKFAEAVGMKIMHQAGGGQDFRTSVSNWEYDQANDQFEIKIEAHWNGKFFRSNDRAYRVVTHNH